MRHFPPECWFDFLRGSLDDARRLEMDQHLGSGCKRCGALVSYWSRVLNAAARDRQLDVPPPALVQTVIDEFANRPPLAEAPAGFSLGVLMFNSMFQPALAPLRASALAGQQLLFESGPFVIDLQLTAEPGRPRNFLTGQILRDQSSDGPPNGIRVTLFSASSHVAEMAVSEYGEFDFDVSSRRSLALQFVIPGFQGIHIQLPDTPGQ